MEFNYVCAMIQGCLRSLEKSFTVKLVDIDRDHVDEIDKIVQNLQSLAKGIGLDHEETRKAHLLLLLNTKWDHIAYFEEEKNFCHILNVLPQMSPYLYFKLVSNLGWHAHLGEVILHFPEFLVREILTSLEADLKVLDSKSAVPFIYCLLSNIFHKIMYLQENCKEKVTEFVKLFTAISKFNFDDIINEMDCSTEAKQQYRGYVYRMLIELVRFCIEKIKKWNVPDDDLYAHSCNYDYAVWPQVTYSSCRGKLCLGIIANKCLAVSEEVTIDTYMSWMEVSIMEDSVEKTLQMCVRESAYKTRQAITSAAELHNAVAGTAALEKRLVAIELKPVTEEDEIAQADTDTILMNLCNPKKTQAKWLRGLINRGIFESAPHMKVVSENARLVDAETMIILLDSAVKFLTNHDIPEEELTIIRKTLKTCLRAQSSEGQLEVLSQFVKRFGLITPLLSETFIQRTTLLFNKLIDDDENKDDIYTEMVWLALEDCESLVKRAFNESLAFCHKAPLILDLVKYIAPSVDIVTPHTNLSLYLGHVLTLMHSIKVSRTNKSIEDFLHLLDLSCGMKILSAESLLFGHVMPSLEPAVSSSRTDDILFYLKIVYVLEPYCEPKTVHYIALLIKILNRCRPRIKDFSSNQVEISTMCIELLQHVMTAIERNEMSNDIKWLKSLAEKSPPLTALHLRPVLCPGTTDEPFQEDKSLFWSWRGLGHGNVLTLLQPYERSTLVTSTLKILPSLTMKEWELIGGGLLSDFEQTLFTFGVLVDSLLVLLQVPAMMENLPCFGHIITNFIHYTEAILMPKMKTKRGLKSIEEVKLKIQLLGSVLPEELESSKRPLLQHLEQRLEDVKTPKKTKKDTASDRSDVIMEA